MKPPPPWPKELADLDAQALYKLLDRNGRGTILSVLWVWWLLLFQFMWLPLCALEFYSGGIHSVLRLPWEISFLTFAALPLLRFIGYPMQCDYFGMTGEYLVKFVQATPFQAREILNVAGNRQEMERPFLLRPAKEKYSLVYSYVRGSHDDGVAMILKLDENKISNWGWNFFFWQDAAKGASIIWPSGLITFIGYFQFIPNENIFSGLFRALFERPFHYLWEALHLRFSMATLASFHVLLVEAIILFGWGSFLYEFWLRRTRNFAMPEGYLLLPEPKRIPQPKFIVLRPPKKPKVKSPDDDEPPPASFFPKPKRTRTKKPAPTDTPSEAPNPEPQPSNPIPPEQWKNWD